MDKLTKEAVIPITILASIIIFVLFVWIFLPSKLTFSKTVRIQANHNSLSRFLSDDVKRELWRVIVAHDKRKKIIDVFDYQGNYLGYLINVKMKVGKDTISSEMRIIPAHAGACYIRWQFEQALGNNPIKKVQRIAARNAIERDMRQMLLSLKRHAEKNENIYGFTIRKMKVSDTLIAVTASIQNEYPATGHIYDQISRLRQYITRQQAAEKNFPMVYVQKIEQGAFETTIGLPINKAVISSGDIKMQRMIAGNILFIECNGGPSRINNAFRAMEDYVEDHQMSSPALPFEMLVTDRLIEKDTTRWITGIYYPVY